MANKLSLQFQKITDWMCGVVPDGGIVKIIDPPSANPFLNRNVRVIGRFYIPDDETNSMIADGAAGAMRWFNRIAPSVRERPWLFCIELPNEPQSVQDYGFCQRLAEFTIKAAELSHGIGMKVVGGNLAEGGPGGITPTEEANLFCALAPGLAECDYWSQHAYWVPDGYPHKEAGYNRYHALRYQTNRAYALARGIKLPKVILSEGGWDFGIVGKPKCGWRTYSDWNRYFADLKRFADDLAQDPDVVTCTLFVSGSNEDWTSFEIDEAQAREVLAYKPCVAQEPPPPVAAKLTIARPLPSNRGSVSQVFGADVDEYQKYGFAGHEGLDYRVPVGTKVFACAPGKVIHAGAPSLANANYGTYVVVNHGKFESWYCHLSSVSVQVGQIVEQGQTVGLSGNSGKSTGPHLHFAIRVPEASNGSKKFVDPWALRVILEG